MNKATKRTIIAGVAAFLVLGTASTAFAYWTATGAGAGSAASGPGQTTLVANQTTVISGVDPGVAPQTVSGTFNNTGTSSAYVTTVTASIGTVTKGPAAGTCTAADYVLTGAVMSVAASIPVGSAVGAWTGVTIAFVNTAANQDACKGATVVLNYAIN
jgi:hypothetical protein